MADGAVLAPGEGRQFPTPFRTMAVVKVDYGQADFAIFESGPPPGHGQPPHVHDSYDEALYVIAGEVLFRLDNRETVATAGTTVFAPRGSSHGFTNTTSQPAQLLVIATPRALELVESLGRLSVDSPPDLQAVQQLFQAHDSRLTSNP